MSEGMQVKKKQRDIKGAWLFISLLLLSFFHPFSEILDRLFPYITDLLGALLYTGVLMAAVYALSDTRRHVVIAVVLALPALILVWVDGVMSSPLIKVAYLGCGLIFVGYTAFRVLNYVLSGGHVVKDKIYGALSVYLLFGHGWAFVYIMVETMNPGSFVGLAKTGFVEGVGSELIYFSFVTLTTLGYGDITPVTITARNLAAMQAVTGVLYIATLIAGLIGTYRSPR
jgi:hypothetical protein